MPLYEWKDKKTGYQVEVFRERFDQYLEAPKDEELPEEERGKERDWEKQISKGIKVERGNTWQGSKGNW
jgi:hypothetical protein